MSLIQRIKNERVDARKAASEDKTNPLHKTCYNLMTTLIGEIETTQKRQKQSLDNISDKDVAKIIKAFIKGINETITKMGPSDDIKLTMLYLERTLLEVYLPTQLSESELSDVIKKTVADGADNIGAIMKELKASYDGLFDGKSASKIAIRELLTIES